jgi:hypothetical protein
MGPARIRDWRDRTAAACGLAGKRYTPSRKRRAFGVLSFLLFFLVAAGPLRAADPAGSEPPAVGRPDDFSQVVGSYRLTATAAPTRLRVEDPLLLTVRITGSGPKAYQPQRRHLRLFPPGTDKDFYLKPLPDKDRHLAAERTWEFAFELRPKGPGVRKVPALRLVYYNPTFRRYQTSYAPAIPLTVTPRPTAGPPPEAVRVFEAPDSLHEVTTGPLVLRREETGWLGLPALLGLLAAPPALCGLGYYWWRRRYPDAARLARRRRSQAAEQALQALGGAADPVRVAGLVAEYLRRRLDLPAEEPTPREAARHLRRLGVAPDLARRAAELFRACDAGRFAPPAPEGVRPADGLAGAAAGLIHDLEAEPCSSAPA